MASKELLKRIDERNYLTEREHREFLNELNKDLEEYEKLKSLMGTPIQDIMKRLEILDILKENIEIVDTDFVDENGDDIFKIQLKPLDSSNKRKVMEWLDEKSD